MVSDIYPRLYPADICATRGKGPLLWFSRNLLEPKTDRIHFFVIKQYLPWDNDYEILESINKGIAIGRLSFYKPEDVEIYRVNLGGDSRLRDVQILLRRQVAAELSKVGRARYDFFLYLQLALGGLSLLLRGKLPPWKPEQIPYGRNKAYICTEAARYGWRARGHPIFKEGVAPTPSAFKQALQDNRLRKIFPQMKGGIPHA
ncbi:hypothetical protein LCGC14_1079700 [marine sediment metagenome]|uniref:Uncharacterized protein n=1 Tax=marine sediment metagenome TaxID=412755 RepID=A0A0F9MFS1_9ZZZZ